MNIPGVMIADTEWLQVRKWQFIFTGQAGRSGRKGAAPRCRPSAVARDGPVASNPKWGGSTRAREHEARPDKRKPPVAG